MAEYGAPDVYGGMGTGRGRSGVELVGTGMSYRVTAADLGRYLRIKVTATDGTPFPLEATAYSEFNGRGLGRSAPGDYDGDGMTDLWFYQDGIWRMAPSSGGVVMLEFGGPGMTAMPGDYDGDGLLDFGLYEESSGRWWVGCRDGRELAGGFIWGGPGYEAVTADYDGDGVQDIAVYGRETGLWGVLLSGSGYASGTVQFGGPGYEAVVGDYDGDGKSDPAVYGRSGDWHVLLSGSGYAWGWAQLGGVGLAPAPGDYDGDGITDLGVYWDGGNRYWILSSATGEVTVRSFGRVRPPAWQAGGYYDRGRNYDPGFVYQDGDFIIWIVQCGVDGSGCRAQTYEISTERWRVSW